jgi:hypothetical protein
MRRLASLAMGLLLAGTVAADEAMLPDGRVLPGSLHLAQNARLEFIPSDKQPPLSLAAIHQVRFSAAAAVRLRSGALHRVNLADGQSVTGELLGLDEQQVRLRTAWAPELAVPRTAVVSLLQAGGYATFLQDDFEKDLEAWKISGSPTLSDKQATSGRRSLLLNAVGQTAVYRLEAPLEAGKVGVNFQQVGAAAGAVWTVEVEFQGNGEAQTVRVPVAGDTPSYTADVGVPPLGGGREPPKGGTPTAEGESREWVARTPGWHRLEVEFSPGSLVVTSDETVLWYSRRQGPGGALQQVRLGCTAAGNGDTGGAAVFDDFSVARAVAELRHQDADPAQDEVWLLSGDQVLGQVPRADRRGVEVRGVFGNRKLDWGEVRGVFLRRQPAPGQKREGESVRVWLRGESGAPADELEGVVRQLDERSLTLVHPVLGEQKIERGRLQRLRGVPSLAKR